MRQEIFLKVLFPLCLYFRAKGLMLKQRLFIIRRRALKPWPINMVLLLFTVMVRRPYYMERAAVDITKRKTAVIFGDVFLPIRGKVSMYGMCEIFLINWQLNLNIDRTRVYATGLSAGGGLCFELALETPDLVAAVAPVAGLPFQPTGHWLLNCNAHPQLGKVPIAMLAATADPFVAYEPGGSVQYPSGNYPGMEQTRDAWLSAMGISAAPTFESFPDIVTSDSYQPQSGLTDSYIELYKYPAGIFAVRNFGITRPSVRGTGGPTQLKLTVHCGPLLEKQIKISISPTRRGRFFSVTQCHDAMGSRG